MKFTLLKKFAEENNIILTDKQIQQFERFAELLVEKNKVMNLTAIDDPKQIEIKHMIDSVSGAIVIDQLGLKDFSLLDIGCGAGFPGIPLKISYPDNEFVLLDSLNKRINFVNEVSSLLELKNLTGIAGRAEDFKERESFDIITSRAVARINVLLEYMLPFAKVGGYVLLYKSGDFKEELDEAANALNILGGKFIMNFYFELPEKGGARNILVIEKVSSTPPKYPRRAGKPTKSPIC